MCNVYEKRGCVLLVQTDHITGELIGTVIEDFYRAGAFNVQVIPTITKKNRPGHLFFIDASPDDNLQIESLIVNELRATGWHRLESVHRHVATEIRRQKVVFDTDVGPLSFTVKIKVVKEQPGHIRPEHASCLALRAALREKGVNLSLHEINQEIIRQLSIPITNNLNGGTIYG